MHHLFRVLALVGIASLCLASQGALANSIGVAQGIRLDAMSLPAMASKI